MDEKQARIVERLLKKLSALRATLSDDERMVLDHLIVGEQAPAQDEVQAHVLKPAKVGAKTPGQDEVRAHVLKPAKVGAKTPGQDEVRAHAFNPAKVGAKTPAQDEVRAHMAQPGGADSKVQWVSTFHVFFDPEKEEYRYI